MPFVLSNLHKTSRTYDSFILQCIGKNTVLLQLCVALRQLTGNASRKLHH